LLKPLAIAKAALTEMCGSISARLCFFGREKNERELLFFSTQKQPERWLLANHNHRKTTDFASGLLFRE
jgi:hypothetical protein